MLSEEKTISNQSRNTLNHLRHTGKTWLAGMDSKPRKSAILA
jgi:hypothetical protein